MTSILPFTFYLDISAEVMLLGSVIMSAYVSRKVKPAIRFSINLVLISLCAFYLDSTRSLLCKMIVFGSLQNKIFNIVNSIIAYSLTLALFVPILHFQYIIATAHDAELKVLPFSPCMSPTKQQNYWRNVYISFTIVYVVLCSLDVVFITTNDPTVNIIGAIGNVFLSVYALSLCIYSAVVCQAQMKRRASRRVGNANITIILLAVCGILAHLLTDIAASLQDQAWLRTCETACSLIYAAYGCAATYLCWSMEDEGFAAVWK